MKKRETENPSEDYMDDQRDGPTLGELVRVARGDRTQAAMVDDIKKVAGEMLTASGHISRIEKGEVKAPSSKLLKMIAEVSQDKAITYDVLKESMLEGYNDRRHGDARARAEKKRRTEQAISRCIISHLIDRGFHVCKNRDSAYKIAGSVSMKPDLALEVQGTPLDFEIVPDSGSDLERNSRIYEKILDSIMRYQIAMKVNQTQSHHRLFIATAYEEVFEKIRKTFDRIPLEIAVSLILVNTKMGFVTREEPLSEITADRFSRLF